MQSEILKDKTYAYDLCGKSDGRNEKKIKSDSNEPTYVVVIL